MITSIVPLPEFSSCNCIFGEGKGGWFNDAEVVESAPGIDVIGRTIPILPAVWNKYKMTVRNAPTGKTYVIVFLTHQKLDIYNLWKQPFVEIYPIYLREYDVPGKPPQLRTNALLFLPQINQVLHEMGVKSVVSVTHMCYKTMDNLGCEDFSHVPKYMLDRMLDDRYGTLVPCDENVVMSLYMGGTEATQHLDTVIDYGCILKGYLPQEVEFIMCQHFLRDILPLLDPSHLMDVTTLAVLSTMDHWSAYYTWIHEKDDSCPRYQNQNLNNDVENILMATAMFQTTDYEINCNPQSMRTEPIHANLMNAQTGLRFNVNQIPDHNKLVKFGEWVREPLGLDFDYARESQCRAVGSYLEDLTVYDKSGELIAYYDLVWWILASGSGLINDTF